MSENLLELIIIRTKTSKIRHCFAIFADNSNFLYITKSPIQPAAVGREGMDRLLYYDEEGSEEGIEKLAEERRQRQQRLRRLRTVGRSQLGDEKPIGKQPEKVIFTHFHI